MLVFSSAVGLVLDDVMLGVRVGHIKKQFDISVEALEANGLKGFKPKKFLRLKPQGDLLLTAQEIASGNRVKDRSEDSLFVGSFIQYARLIPRIVTDDTVDQLNNSCKRQYDELKYLKGKHIFTDKFGDGEIDHILVMEGGLGLEVKFHSNAEGQLTLTAAEFLLDIKESKLMTV
jgi:hypothetical protein